MSGRVQGVWFRAGAREKALALGLSGHARNLPDGRVEVLVCGAEAECLAMKDWLWQGTPSSRVDEVACEPTADSAPATFTTG